MDRDNPQFSPSRRAKVPIGREDSSEESSSDEESSPDERSYELADNEDGNEVDDCEDNDDDDDHSSSEVNVLSESCNDDNSPASDDDEFEEEDENEIDDDNINAIDDNMPLAERLQLQKAKKVNMSEQREKKARALKLARSRLANTGINDDTKEKNVETSSSKEKTKKSKSKHAPTEASSKWLDFYRNQKKGVVLNGVGVDPVANRFKPRDPRIENPMVSEQSTNQDEVDKKYEFIQEIRNKEISTLKKQLAAVKTTGKKGQRYRRQLGIEHNRRSEIKEKLKQLLHEKAEYTRRQVDRAAKLAVTKKMKDAVAEGKSGVYYPKRKELKRIELEAKFDEIRKRGGDSAVDKVLAKRRKKNKSRDAGLSSGLF